MHCVYVYRWPNPPASSSTLKYKKYRNVLPWSLPRSARNMYPYYTDSRITVSLVCECVVGGGGFLDLNSWLLARSRLSPELLITSARLAVTPTPLTNHVTVTGISQAWEPPLFSDTTCLSTVYQHVSYSHHSVTRGDLELLSHSQDWLNKNIFSIYNVFSPRK